MNRIPNVTIIDSNTHPSVVKTEEEWKQQLTPEEYHVLRQGGTEARWKGYTADYSSGVYSCRACGNPLFTSQMKFDSGCGWPAFDDCIPGSIVVRVDEDGHRTEELCAKCHSHLGHIFTGERFTQTNTRHCINSICMLKHDNASEE